MATLGHLLVQVDRADPARVVAVLADLATLQRRMEGSNYSANWIDDPEFDALEIDLAEDDVHLIARWAGAILADAGESDRARTTVGFVLNKANVGEALAAVVAAITGHDMLPPNVARQCASSYDSQVFMGTPEVAGLDLAAVGAAFKRYGLPWDDATQHLVVDDL